MIQSLSIANYAIIDKMNIDLSEGLNIITGETGAGKSILLGATGLILGQRANSKSSLDPKLKTVVEAVFKLEDNSLQKFFTEHDLDFDSEAIIRREIAPSGKSRAFINDTPVSLQILGTLAGELVDLHQQFDTLELQQESFQLSALDALANHRSILDKYQLSFGEYKQLLSDLKTLEQAITQSKKEEDFLKFQLKELDDLSIELNEEQGLESEQGLLSNTEHIQLAIGQASNTLEEGAQPIIPALQQLSIQIENAGKSVPKVIALQEKLETSIIDLEEWAREARQILDQIDSDPERLEVVNSRLSDLYQLFQKHQVQNSEQLINIHSKISDQLAQITNADEQLDQLNKRKSELVIKLDQLSDKLTANRKKASKTFEKEVSKLLGKLHMENAILKIDIQASDRFTATGKDQIQFLFTANKGGKLQPIKKVASGGELSRLSLCIKSVVADKMKLPTLIFDEIDAGISGEVALKMGGIIEKLAERHQIIMITHSPQIASRASNHLFISKKEEKNRTLAAISKLNQEQRKIEIAKMLSGDPPSDAAILNAKELLKI